MPVVTVLDDEGVLVEEDQRSVVRFVVQDGFAADVIFAAGTGNYVRFEFYEVAMDGCIAADGAGEGLGGDQSDADAAGAQG